MNAKTFEMVKIRENDRASLLPRMEVVVSWADFVRESREMSAEKSVRKLTTDCVEKFSAQIGPEEKQSLSADAAKVCDRCEKLKKGRLSLSVSHAKSALRVFAKSQARWATRHHFQSKIGNPKSKIKNGSLRLKPKLLQRTTMPGEFLRLFYPASLFSPDRLITIKVGVLDSSIGRVLFFPTQNSSNRSFMGGNLAWGVVRIMMSTNRSRAVGGTSARERFG